MTTNDERMREISREERTAHEYSRALAGEACLARQQAEADARARRGPDPAIERAHQQRLAETAAAQAKAAELQAQRDAAREAQLEADLAPIKEAKRREWLIAHPGQSAFIFDSQIWKLMRPTVIAEMQDQRLANEIMAQKKRAGSSYSL